jgi:hypothetical protein
MTSRTTLLKKVNNNNNNIKSPYGLGFSALNYDYGTLMKGYDNELYTVKKSGSRKIWKKIDLDNLPSKYYRDVWYPIFKKIENDNDDNIYLDKIGGKPLLLEGDLKKIVDMTFVFQFRDPVNKDYMYQLFVNDDSMEMDNKVRKIKLSNISTIDLEIQIDSELSNYDSVKTIIPYEIVSWKKSKELIDLDEFSKIYQINTSIGTNNDLLFEYYEKSIYNIKSGLKYGGTSIFCQYEYDLTKYKNFIQIEQTSIIPIQWGDAGTAHIWENNKTKMLYLTWDCC